HYKLEEKQREWIVEVDDKLSFVKADVMSWGFPSYENSIMSLIQSAIPLSRLSALDKTLNAISTQGDA
ncbi:MAG: hypothetical protein Q9199_008036, partial [Rusavskia elegans]